MSTGRHRQARSQPPLDEDDACGCGGAFTGTAAPVRDDDGSRSCSAHACVLCSIGRPGSAPLRLHAQAAAIDQGDDTRARTARSFLHRLLSSYISLSRIVLRVQYRYTNTSPSFVKACWPEHAHYLVAAGSLAYSFIAL